MNRDEIRAGMRAALPTLLASMPFGILLGAVSANMGLSLGEVDDIQPESLADELPFPLLELAVTAHFNLRPCPGGPVTFSELVD